MNYFDCTAATIRGIVSLSHVPEDPHHAENTLTWLRQLDPAMDDALQIAALGHDIERAVEDRRIQKADFPTFEEFKAAHAAHSAVILREIMKACNAPQAVTDDACRLVRRHETGGDPRSDLLMNADSISFFEVNLPLYYRRNGYERALRRSIWGYGRLSDPLKRALAAFTYNDPGIGRIVKEVIRYSSGSDSSRNDGE
jgi:hypothetical protein